MCPGVLGTRVGWAVIAFGDAWRSAVLQVETAGRQAKHGARGSVREKELVEMSSPFRETLEHSPSAK